MGAKTIQRVWAIDSHTGGEPTRVILRGAPELAGHTMAEKLQDFRERHDAFRSAVVNEPRGSDVMVGALLCESSESTCEAGVLFFNNVGMLGMCGHGTIGLVTTLASQGKIGPGRYRFETPVGIVATEYHENGEVSVQNIPCYRYAQRVPVEVAGHGLIYGDIAWGGNWFFLVEQHGQEVTFHNVERLLAFTWEIRQALERQGITGKEGQEIDHIELFAPSERAGIHSKNFVLCPGKAYDRSPCGTGTSAKLACLYADGKIREGDVWLQESIIGSVFAGSIAKRGEALIPTIRGSAFITGETTLLLDPDDPFCWGIR